MKFRKNVGVMLACLWLVLAGCVGNVRAADTNVLVWHNRIGRVDADLRGIALWPLLEKIAVAADWHVFVEPDTERNVSVKFKDFSSADALKMMLGDLSFALVPQTNGPTRLYVFRTLMQNATREVAAPKLARRVANELLVRVKPGTDMDALAKSVGAKIIGRMDKLGVYLLQFPDAAATDAALAALQNNSDVLDSGYNYYFDPPPSAQALAGTPGGGPLSLTLNPPGTSGKAIVGLVDMNVQSLGAQLNEFILPQLSVAGDAPANDTDITHGTAMAYAILQAVAQQSSGGSSVQIQPVDVYGGAQTTTSWNVALGIQAAVNSGATVLNLSLGSSGDSTVLDSIIGLALADNIVIFGAAGNTPVNTPTFPGAISGVYDVTALSAPGQLASYANYWAGDSLALPGTSIVYFGGQAYQVQGTSTSTAYASGAFAGSIALNPTTAAQILAAMKAKFPVPGQ